MKSDIGLYGLGVMGENLAINIESRGYVVSICNYNGEGVQQFADGRGNKSTFICHIDEREFVLSIARPRQIFVMIKAGEPVDQTFDRLAQYMEDGDIFIDGGNSDYRDTCRRVEKAEIMGLMYVGSGVSGGEEGALNGPSLMPGGSSGAWDIISQIFTAIAARAGDEQQPCAAWMGALGAGHLVKTVHNGIEYGDMQLICESYDILRKIGDAQPDALADVFDGWNKAELCSYLIEITADILRVRDADGEALVDKISDTAMQKGTGKWASIAALQQNVPLTLITEAVYARMISSRKDERVAASALGQHPARHTLPLDKLALQLSHALYAAKIISYAQGFALIQNISQHNDWGIDIGEVSRIWRGGCIIRSSFLTQVTHTYSAETVPTNLMTTPFFSSILRDNIPDLREIISLGVLSGIPMPTFSAALAYYDSYHCAHLPANLLQAQRDYFGAHMFERVDKPQGEFFHYNWTGQGGPTASTVYSR